MKRLILAAVMASAPAVAAEPTPAQLNQLGMFIYCMDGGEIKTKAGKVIPQSECQRIVMSGINSGEVEPQHLAAAERIAEGLYQQERRAKQAQSDSTWAAVQQNARPQKEGMQWRTVCLAGRGCTMGGYGDW